MNTNTRRSLLVSRFRSLRNAGTFAVLSVGTINALAAIEANQAKHLMKRIAKERSTDDRLSDIEGGIIGPIEQADQVAPVSVRLSDALLTDAERASLPNYRGTVYRTAAPVAAEEPLPSDFVPAPVEEYAPLIVRDAEIERQARIEADAEIAQIARDTDATSFDSEFDKGHPIDFAPIAVQSVAAPVTVKRDNPVTVGAPSAFDVLRNAVLALGPVPGRR